MPLYGDITRICQCLTAHPHPARVRARAATVEQALGRAIAWEAAVEAMVAGFSEALNLHLESGALTDKEIGLAESLREEKYATPAWTCRI